LNPGVAEDLFVMDETPNVTIPAPDTNEPGYTNIIVEEEGRPVVEQIVRCGIFCDYRNRHHH
jgi:hypothetical protein